MQAREAIGITQFLPYHSLTMVITETQEIEISGYELRGNPSLTEELQAVQDTGKPVVFGGRAAEGIDISSPIGDVQLFLIRHDRTHPQNDLSRATFHLQAKIVARTSH